MTFNQNLGSLSFEKAKSHRKRKKLRPSTTDMERDLARLGL